MYPWPDGFSILGETTCFDLIGQQLKERSPEKNTLEMLNDVEIMQYTGLHDKNGKEIYEGDNAEGNLFDRRVPIMGTIVYDIAYACYALQNEAGLTPLFKIAEIEIIGNIYENPELLETQ
jgi:uncharacterized phage protein (TIGR01671 family)